MERSMACMNSEQDFHDWLPIRVWQVNGQWRVDWCWFGDKRLTQPFFRDDVEKALRLPFNQAFRRESGLDALRQWQVDSPGLAPTALIFHASRCGSTLMAQMLAALPDSIVLSEPPPLDSLLRAQRSDPGLVGHLQDHVAALLSAYGQPRQGNEQRLFVKLDTWNLFEAPILAKLYPDVPCIFLYRDPLEIAVSQTRQPGMQCVPGLLGTTGLDESTDADERLSSADFISRVIGRTLEAGLELCLHYGGVPVNYCELPDALWERLAPLFEISGSDTAVMQRVASFDAKRPAMHFNADSEDKRRSASPELRASIEHWTTEPYEKLEALRRRNNPQVR
nr:sulfotransferase [Pseudomonas sp. LPH1]